MTKAYRNHPSVIFYQIENELVYINGMNIYGGDLPLIEREMLEVYKAGKANDPTRPVHYQSARDAAYVDMVSVMYPPVDYLAQPCLEGRGLGETGLVAATAWVEV